MPVRTSPYFNSPQFAQAADNLMQLFAPPSGTEAAGWANANATKEKAARLEDFYTHITDPNTSRDVADRYGVGAGAYAPTQSYYSVDQGNATSRANNAADNARAKDVAQMGDLADLYKPLDPGQVRPELPQEIAGRFGVNAVPATQGAPKPLSETEWNAAQDERLREKGMISDQELVDAIMGKQTPVQAMGPDNRPTFMSPGAAVRTGAQPYTKPDDTKFDNYLAVGPDNKEKRFLGYTGPDGRIYDASTRQPVLRVIRKEGTGGGTQFETDGKGGIRLSIGNSAGMTTARTTDLQQQEADAGRAVDEMSSLFAVLRPDDLGAAGNINQVLTDYGAQVFPTLARPDVAATRAQLRATTLGVARSLVGDARLSDADRHAANEVMVSDGLGESLPGARAKLAALIALSAYRKKYAATVRTGGEQLPPLDGAMLGRLVDEGDISPQVAQTYASTVLNHHAEAGGSIIPGVVDPEQSLAAPGANPTAGQDAIPTVATPQEAQALPPGTKFRTPDGRVKVRP